MRAKDIVMYVGDSYKAEVVRKQSEEKDIHASWAECRVPQKGG